MKSAMATSPWFVMIAAPTLFGTGRVGGSERKSATQNDRAREKVDAPQINLCCRRGHMGLCARQQGRNHGRTRECDRILQREQARRARTETCQHKVSENGVSRVH
jgi:hypothetical protein